MRCGIRARADTRNGRPKPNLQPDRRPNRRMTASQITRPMRAKPEIGLAAAGGADGAAGADVALADAGGRDIAGWTFRFSANCFINCAAVAWIMPTPRPYWATAPDRVRSVCTSTLEPLGVGSRRNDAAAFAPPRPLASVPCALTRAVWLTSSISSNLTTPANVSATGPSRTEILPL